MRHVTCRRLVVAGIVAVSLIVLFFRPYFFQGSVPFPSNLLVSTYAPWKYVPDPHYPNGPANKPIGFDNIRQFFPNRSFTEEMLDRGIFPLWNPYIFSGTPYFAAIDTGILYPLGVVFRLLPLIDAWSVLVMVQPMLSMAFMFLFLRSMGRSFPGAVLASLAYAFSGWMIVYWEESLILEHAFLWLPLGLYASNCIWSGNPIRGTVLLVFSLVSSIFAGFFQMSVYVLLMLLCWNAYRWVSQDTGKRKIKPLLIVLISLLSAVCIAGIQLLPTIEAYANSPRGTMDALFLFRDHLAPWQHLLTFIAPDYWGNPGSYNYFGGAAFYFEKMLYFGILPFVFAMYALVGVKERHLGFWKWTALITLIMGFSQPLAWLPYWLRIPVLGSSYPTRIFALTLVANSILMSTGIDAFRTRPRYRLIVGILAALAFVAGVMWFFAGFVFMLTSRYQDTIALCGSVFLTPLCNLVDIPWQSKHINPMYASVSLRNMIVPSGLILLSAAAVWMRRYSTRFFVFCSVAVVISAGLFFSHKYTYFSERRFVYPDLSIIGKLRETAGYDRVWGYGNAFLEKNLAQQLRIYSTDGYGFLSPVWYGELLNTIRTRGTVGGPMRRSDTDLFEASEKDALGSSNPYRLRMMSLLGVRYILETTAGDDKDHKTRDDRFPPSLFSPVYEEGIWRIWKYEKALPRAFLATRVLIEKDPNRVAQILYDPATDLSTTVVVESETEFIRNMTAKNLGSERKESTVRIARYEPNEIQIDVTAEQPGMLFLSDTYYPGWEVFVDGKQTDIMKADMAFRAVPVGEGAHTVEFFYRPQSFRLGILVSGIGMAMITVLLYSLFRKRI